MKKTLIDFGHGISRWFHSLKRWQKRLVITMVVLFCIFWLLVISDVSEWWHWSEWQEHIRNEYR